MTLELAELGVRLWKNESHRPLGKMTTPLDTRHWKSGSTIRTLTIDIGGHGNSQQWTQGMGRQTVSFMDMEARHWKNDSILHDSGHETLDTRHWKAWECATVNTWHGKDDRSRTTVEMGHWKNDTGTRGTGRKGLEE